MRSWNVVARIPFHMPSWNVVERIPFHVRLSCSWTDAISLAIDLNGGGWITPTNCFKVFGSDRSYNYYKLIKAYLFGIKNINHLDLTELFCSTDWSLNWRMAIWYTQKVGNARSQREQSQMVLFLVCIRHAGVISSVLPLVDHCSTWEVRNASIPKQE